MIVLYEPYASKYIHFDFINGFLHSLIGLDEEIHYYGDESQVCKFKEYETLQSISFHAIPIPDYDKAGDKLSKFWMDFKNLKYIKKNTPKEAKIIITDGLPQTILFSKFLFRKRIVHFIIHGQMSYISEIRCKPTEMFYYMKYALTSSPNRFKFIVLGESIKQNVLKVLPKLKDQLYSIDHPYLSKQTFVSKKFDVNDIKIGTIGVGLEKKGILSLNTIVNNLCSKKNIKLFHIGRVDNQLKAKLDDRINIPFKNYDVLIPYGDYSRKINDLDFILFLYPVDSYKFTASGALFEAFALGKPVIALKNEFFDYVQTKVNSKVGFFCNDISNMIEVIREIADLSSDTYQTLCDNSYNALNYFSPNAISEQIKLILKNK